MLRPSSSLPLMASIALRMASSVAKVTNPKPRERPVSRSLMILASRISPYWLKACSRPRSSVAQASPPTKHRYSAPPSAISRTSATETLTRLGYSGTRTRTRTEPDGEEKPTPMPPKAKKDAAPAERPILGRFSSHLKIGIVGLPNVGKSTFFNIVTKLSIPAENFPFCTIEPNEARVNVPDERFDWLCKLFEPKSEVSAYLEINDIAGLVRGASAGEGLGNAFLSHIRAVDGIFHVLRAFEDSDITHIDDTVDPVRDLETISQELRLKDIEFVQAKIDDLEKQMKRSNDKQLKIEHELCQRVMAHLQDGKDIRLGDWKTLEIEILNTFQLLTAKPVVYLVNMSEKDYLRKKNKFLPKIHAWVQEHGGETIIPFSCAFEQKLVDMPADEAAKYCAENQTVSLIPKIIKTGFSAIHLIYFFTAGPDEVKCWQIRKQSKAPQAAGAIHTDFERGFICAEVMKFEDLKELGTESAVKAAGKYRQEGKTYVVQDGDIIFFKFNVSGGGKK